MNHLLGLWLLGNENESETVREGLDAKIDSYAAGKLEHAVDTILSIWETSNKEGVAPSASVTPPGLRGRTSSAPPHSTLQGTTCGLH